MKNKEDLNKITEEVDAMLLELLQESSYFISGYNQDIIKEFINVGEEGLAFDGLIYPFYTEGHALTPKAEDLVKRLSEKMDREFPPLANL